MGLYDDIIASYLEKQARLRAQLKLLYAGDGQTVTLPVKAAIERIEREIRDLDGAIYRCSKKSALQPVEGPVPYPSRPTSPQKAEDHRAKLSNGQHLAHIIFRCDQAGVVITTGLEIEAAVFEGLRTARVMRCRFCGEEHAWKVVRRVPATAVLMSTKAEDFLGRSVQSEAYAAQATDPGIRDLYARMADQWYRLAIEHEAKAAALT